MTGTTWIVGQGVVGRRIERFLSRTFEPALIRRWDSRVDPLTQVSRGDVVLMAHPGPQAAVAADFVAAGVHVVAVGDRVDEIDRLLGLDTAAFNNDATLLVGAAMAPGLAGLLARFAAQHLAVVDEIHIAVHGTAGPACARVYHDALSQRARVLRHGYWTDHVGGSGRELCWFPEPIGAMDSYLAGMTDPILLHEVFPTADRVSARRTARRRDRFTARLPMLRAPHPEGAVGALRVEVSGSDANGGRACIVYGVAELVATAAAAMSAAVAIAIHDDTMPRGVVIAGDERLDTVALLRSVESFQVRIQSFTGVPHPQGAVSATATAAGPG